MTPDQGSARHGAPRLTARRLLILLLAATAVAAAYRLLVPGTRESLEEVRRSHAALGTFCTFIVLAPEGCAERILDSMDSLTACLDTELGTYADGGLTRLNRAGAAAWTDLSDPLRGVLELSLEMAACTDSLFDPTLGALVAAWDFGGDPSVPDGATLREALQACGLASLRVTGDSLVLAPGMRLDLGAVAKGRVSDAVFDLAMERGARAALVEIGGEVRCGGDPAAGRIWTVGLRNPRGEGVLELLRMEGGAVATSGDYESYFMDDDGVRYCHILDPRTGMPETGVASATVIARDCGTADALATALCVGGIPLAAALPDTLFEEILLVTEDRAGRTETWRRSGAER